MRKDYEHYEEYIGCDCMSVAHVLYFSYFPPEKGETLDSEDDMIVLTTLADNWRYGIWPFFWDPKWEYLKEQFTKEYWVNFFIGSVWARFAIGLKYIFTGNTKSAIYGGTIINEDSLDKLYNIFNWFATKNQKPEGPILIISDLSDKTFSLSFYIERIKDRLGSEDRFESLDTNICFTKAKFFKRLRRGIKYAFGYYNNMELGFSISPDQASQLKGLIIQIQQEIIDTDEKNNSNKPDS